MKRLIPLLLLALALVACGNAAANTGTAITPAPTPPTTAVPTDTPTSPPQHFHVGQTVKVGDVWQITITSAKNGGTADYLKSGQVFLDFEVSAKNTSNTEQTFSSFSFTARDADGNSYTAGYDPNAAQMISGKVESGQPLKGGLTFVVSKAVHSYNLLYEQNFLASGQVIWDIKI